MAKMTKRSFIDKFNKDKIKQVFFMLVLFGFGVSIGLFATPKNESPQATQNVDEKLIPELIADQLISGDLDCHGLSLLRYEGCLLFQSTLGVWKNFGMPKADCPPVGVEVKAEESQNQNIQPEDVMSAKESTCFKYLYAINVANIVPVLINTSNYAFYEFAGFGNDQPGTDAELCMAVRRGICGNQTAVGISLFEMAEIEARPIEFYYSINGQRQSHIIVEAEIDGEYRPVDTTYGAYWLKPKIGQPLELLTTDILIAAKGNVPPVWNNVLLPYNVYQIYDDYDLFEYLKYDPDIIRGGKGEIKIKVDDGIFEENFAGIPNFIGDNLYNSQFGGISFVFTGSRQKIEHLQISVRSFGASATDPVELCVDQLCQPYSADKEVYDFIISNPAALYLRSSMDVAYLVLDKIWWDGNSPP